MKRLLHPSAPEVGNTLVVHAMYPGHRSRFRRTLGLCEGLRSLWQDERENKARSRFVLEAMDGFSELRFSHCCGPLASNWRWVLRLLGRWMLSPPRPTDDSDDSLSSESHQVTVTQRK